MTETERNLRNEHEVNHLSYAKIAEKYKLPMHYIKRVCSSKFLVNEERKKQKAAKDLEFEKKVIELLPSANSINHLCNLMGYRGVDGYYTKIKKTIEKYNLSTEHFGSIHIEPISNGRNQTTKMTDDEYFVDNHKRNGKQTIMRLITTKKREYKCEECGLSEWNGKLLILQIHHINEKHDDNRLENLKILCPNCHAQVHYGEHSDRYNILVRSVYKSIRPSKTNNINKKEEKSRITLEPDQIIEDFKDLGTYKAVASKYGLSDNGIRKRCKKLGIYDEIRKYVIERARNKR